MGGKTAVDLIRMSVDQTATKQVEGLSEDDQRRLRNNLSVTCWTLAALLTIGLAFTILEVPSHFSAALLWALASLATGSIGGFLFAIPRVPRSSTVASKSQADSAGSSEDVREAKVTIERGFGLGINTNLEEISDWLTKILVGVGLIQLRSLPQNIWRIGNYVGQGLGTNQETVASGIVIYFFGLGFLGGYLLTRMFLGPAFRLADQATTSGLEQKVAQAQALAIAAQATSQAADEKSAVSGDVETAVGELSKPDRPPGRIEQLIRILQRHRDSFPLERKLNIVLARLYAEGTQNYDQAIQVLQEFITKKTEASEGRDINTADAFFNIACYYSKKMEKANGELRTQLEERGFGYLKKSVELAPQNAKDILVDKDLAELSKSPRVRELGITQP
jgi:hypothetical protein